MSSASVARVWRYRNLFITITITISIKVRRRRFLHATLKIA